MAAETSSTRFRSVCVGYYHNFLAQLDHQVREGMLQPRHRDYLTIHDDPQRLLEKLQVATLPEEPRLRVRT
jgi:predicted Rossmann-fold nucleotide-binding protein